MHLDERDRITYLANVIFIANLDGVISAKETAALDEIRATIGAKKASFAIALKHASSGGYTPVKIDNFVAQVSNLADMLYLAIVDGEFSTTAKSVVSDFSKAIQLTPEQLTVLGKEAVNRLRITQLALTCSSCGAGVSGDSQYCPRCGASLTATSVDSEFKIPDLGFAIEFCESTSAGFPAGLKYAQAAPSFASCVRNKKTWYLASWPETAFEDVIKLAELLNGFRNRKSYHNGAELQWGELFGFVWCASERNKSYRPTLYCFGKDENQLNPWGCKQARLDWTEWARWFSYGRFERGGLLRRNATIWVFDKNRIRHEAMANLHRFRYCPYMRSELVEAVLGALPDKVEITDDGPWKYSYSHEQVPGSIKIVEVEKSDGLEFKHEYYADGVRPRNSSDLEEILRNAFAQARVTDVKPNDLVR